MKTMTTKKAAYVAPHIEIFHLDEETMAYTASPGISSENFDPNSDNAGANDMAWDYDPMWDTSNWEI